MKLFIPLMNGYGEKKYSSMAGSVIGNPVSRWEASELTRDLLTGRKPEGVKLNKMTVLFSFPYSVPI